MPNEGNYKQGEKRAFRMGEINFKQSNLSGSALGITDKMEARRQPPLLIPQAWTWDEGVSSYDSDLFLPFFG